MLEITDAASEVLHRAQEAATRFNPDARIRLFELGSEITVGLADAPEETDFTIEHEGVTLFVASGVSGVLDVSEHETLVVTPS